MKKQSTGTMAWTDNVRKKDEKIKQKKEQLNKVIEDIFEPVTKAEPTPQNINTVNVDTKRLYVTNIPFNSNEGEVRTVFEKYGTVVSMKLPKGRGGTLTGYCFVTFSTSEEAMHAYASLDNRIVMGRIMHLKPAFEDDKKDEAPPPIVEEKSSYKKLQKREMIDRLED